MVPVAKVSYMVGVILLDVETLGQSVSNVPAFLVPMSTEFRQATPVLLGTNVILAVCDKVHRRQGRWFMPKARRLSDILVFSF